jgi:hypothetical protein
MDRRFIPVFFGDSGGGLVALPEPEGLVVLPRHAAESSLARKATQPAEGESGLSFQKIKPEGSFDTAGLASRSGEVATFIRFDNYRAGDVDLYWLDYEGKRVFYGSLGPGRSQLQETYVTHPWVEKGRLFGERMRCYFSAAARTGYCGHSIIFFRINDFLADIQRL